jgi:hypothetical protein
MQAEERTGNSPDHIKPSARIHTALVEYQFQDRPLYTLVTFSFTFVFLKHLIHAIHSTGILTLTFQNHVWGICISLPNKAAFFNIRSPTHSDCVLPLNYVITSG